MAELADGVLTITGAGWYRHLADPPRAEADADLPKDSEEAEGPRIPEAPSLRDPLVGIWRNDKDGRPFAALQIHENGRLAWNIFGETDRETLNAQWTREQFDEKLSYSILLQSAETRTNGGPLVVGRLIFEAPNRLQWRPIADRAAPREAHARSNMNTCLAFHRTDAVPRWKPKAPILPTRGMTKETVIRMLGQPSGIMSSGGRQILVYPWGSVWLTNDVVVSSE